MEGVSGNEINEAEKHDESFQEFCESGQIENLESRLVENGKGMGGRVVRRE